MLITGATVSEAWVGALEALAQPGARTLTPLIVNVTGFSGGEAPEVTSMRAVVDEALLASDKRCSLETTAGTIFPLTVWKRHQAAGATEFFKRYLAIAPRLRGAHRRNNKGTYFERMIAWQGKNQLDHVLSTWHRSIHRRSALQVVIFDPMIDHTAQPRMGFPCLDYVVFTPDDDGGLSVTALYATQYIFDRGYGNYLGLCRLGSFMASEMGLSFRQLTCVASSAQLGTINKTKARTLLDKIHAASASGPHVGVVASGTAA